MASANTNANASADARGGRKRTRGTADQKNPNPPSATKRPKKETKLDRLKAELKQAAGLLKNRLVNLQGYLVNEKVAKESAGWTYTALLDECDLILTGMEPNRNALALLKAPFVDNFEPEEVILARLGQVSMIAHSRNVSSIAQLLAKVAELTEAVLDGLVDDEEEGIQWSPPASVDNIMKRRLVVDDSVARITRPSDLSQPKYFRHLNESRFALHRPPNHTVLPLALLHPIFAEFVANVELHEPTPEDNRLVLELCEVMSRPWEDEPAQSEKFRQILAKHYNIQLYPAEVASTKRTTDGHAIVGNYMYVVFEMKGWNGKGDLEVQASLYPLEAFRPVLRNKKDPLDVLPCIIVYCVGTLVGFSGTVLTNRYQLECLTECLPLHTNVHENAIATRLARTFGAFRIAVEKLHKHYQNLVSRSIDELQTQERKLRVTFPYPDSYETKDGRVEFTYDSRVDEKLIFVATTTGGAKVFVKFTRRYSEKAHRLCAEAGVAPSLLGFRSLPAGWYMAVMEYLDNQTYRVLRPEDGSNLILKAEISRVVKVLHDGGFVHGDIRDVNMMTRHQWSTEEGAQNVFLLDFDWAGPKGVTKYPPNLNLQTVKRHEGAKDGALITQEHDWAMVHCIFDSTGPL